VMRVRCGERIEAGEPLCTLYVNNEKYLDDAIGLLQSAIVISEEKGEVAPMIYDIVRGGRA